MIHVETAQRGASHRPVNPVDRLIRDTTRIAAGLAAASAACVTAVAFTPLPVAVGTAGAILTGFGAIFALWRGSRYVERRHTRRLDERMQYAEASVLSTLGWELKDARDAAAKDLAAATSRIEEATRVQGAVQEQRIASLQVTMEHLLQQLREAQTRQLKESFQQMLVRSDSLEDAMRQRLDEVRAALSAGFDSAESVARERFAAQASEHVQTRVQVGTGLAALAQTQDAARESVTAALRSQSEAATGFAKRQEQAQQTVYAALWTVEREQRDFHDRIQGSVGMVRDAVNALGTRQERAHAEVSGSITDLRASALERLRQIESSLQAATIGEAARLEGSLSENLARQAAALRHEITTAGKEVSEATIDRLRAIESSLQAATTGEAARLEGSLSENLARQAAALRHESTTAGKEVNEATVERLRVLESSLLSATTREVVRLEHSFGEKLTRESAALRENMTSASQEVGAATLERLRATEASLVETTRGESARMQESVASGIAGQTTVLQQDIASAARGLEDGINLVRDATLHAEREFLAAQERSLRSQGEVAARLEQLQQSLLVKLAEGAAQGDERLRELAGAVAELRAVHGESMTESRAGFQRVAESLTSELGAAQAQIIEKTRSFTDLGREAIVGAITASEKTIVSDATANGLRLTAIASELTAARHAILDESRLQTVETRQRMLDELAEVREKLSAGYAEAESRTLATLGSSIASLRAATESKLEAETARLVATVQDSGKSITVGMGEMGAEVAQVAAEARNAVAAQNRGHSELSTKVDGVCRELGEMVVSSEKRIAGAMTSAISLICAEIGERVAGEVQGMRGALVDARDVITDGLAGIGAKVVSTDNRIVAFSAATAKDSDALSKSMAGSFTAFKEQVSARLTGDMAELQKSVGATRDHAQKQLENLHSALEESGRKIAEFQRQTGERAQGIQTAIEALAGKSANIEKTSGEFAVSLMENRQRWEARLTDIAGQMQELGSTTAQVRQSYGALVQETRQVTGRIDELSASLQRELQARLVSIDSHSAKSQTAAEQANKEVRDLAAAWAQKLESVRKDVQSVLQAEIVKLAAIQPKIEEIQQRTFQEVANKGTEIEGRVTALVDQVRKSAASVDQTLKKANSLNTTLFQAFERRLTPDDLKIFRETWVPRLGLNLGESSIAYLAHRICLTEDRCLGRLATSIQDGVLRILCALAFAPRRLRVLEIGCLFGVNLACIHECAQSYFRSIKLVGIDPLEGYYDKSRFDILTNVPVDARVFQHNVGACRIPPNQIRLIKRLSTDRLALKEARQDKYDLLIIDGDHSYKGVEYDFEHYLPLVAPGGIVIFDDYGDQKSWPDVTRFVDEVAKRTQTVELIGTAWRTAVFRRR